jgi:radical SAM superfamily enzyme YgiQ (UPF0313 family)
MEPNRIEAPSGARDRSVSLREPGAVLLLSCYELGRQPLTVAGAIAVLRGAGFHPAALDLARQRLDLEMVRRARVVAIAVPMHTALRVGVVAAEKVRALRTDARVVFFGLYAALNGEALLGRGAHAVIGGECDDPLRRLLEDLDAGGDGAVPGVRTAAHPAAPWIERPVPPVPERDLLPPLVGYAHLEVDGRSIVAGQIEASRGCRHLCRHCPIPPVYGGRFFIVPEEVVVEDARRQIVAGARHLSFADADFLNGPGHAFRVLRALHAAHPDITFDVTAKVEHLLKHRDRLAEMRQLGVLFAISAVESLDDRVLRILDKGHTRADVEAVLRAARSAGLAIRPTFVAFTPWSGREAYRDLLAFIAREDLIDAVDPVQLTIRLLVPPGSLLASHPEMTPYLGPLDAERFTWTWAHPDPEMDRLHREATALVEAGGDVFALAAAAGVEVPAAPRLSATPRLSEPWFCCAEPMRDQLDAPFA